MAVDKKSQHVGNHGGAYTDIDGMRKQFTVVDHDKKTKMLSPIQDKPTTGWEAEYRGNLIKRILAIPASLCHLWFQDFTIRGEAQKSIEWNTDMLLDNGVPTSRLRDICVVLENTQESRGKLF